MYNSLTATVRPKEHQSYDDTARRTNFSWQERYLLCLYTEITVGLGDPTVIFYLSIVTFLLLLFLRLTYT